VGESESAALSTLGNSNFTGGFLGIVLPIAAALWIVDEDRRSQSTALLGAILGGWILARSRGGWLAGIAGLGVVGGAFYSTRWRWARWAAAAVVAGTIAIAVGSVAIGLADPEGRFGDQDLLARGRWWQAAGAMWLDSPIAGKGPNTFAVEGIQHRSLDDALEREFRFADDPHSVFFSLLAGAGVLGGLGYLGLLAWTASQARLIERAAMLTAGFLGAAAAYLVQSLMSIDEPTLRVALWTALAGVGASMSALTDQGTRRPQGKPRKKGRPSARPPLKALPVVALLTLVGLGSIAWSIGFIIQDARVKHAVDLFAAGDPVAGQQEFDKALGFRDDYEYRSRYGNLVGQIAVRSEGDEKFVTAMERAFSHLEEFPDFGAVRTNAQLAVELAPFVEGYDAVAMDMYRRALTIDPLNPALRFEAAEGLILIGRPQAAATLLEEGLEVLDGYQEFWGALALARAEGGDRSGALEAIQRALQTNPDDRRALRAQELLRSDDS
ncbi:MAG: O-antigen ligase family protein, partial [Acidimicrobiia bacterium]